MNKTSIGDKFYETLTNKKENPAQYIIKASISQGGVIQEPGRYDPLGFAVGLINHYHYI